MVVYDGASVNSRKKNLNLFSPPFFYQNSRKNIFKFIFSNVFPKTAEKKYLNLFSPTFFQKQEKNIFKYIFSYVFLKTAEKKYLNIFSPTFFQKQEKKYI